MPPVATTARVPRSRRARHNPRFGHQGSDVDFQANMIATISDDFGVVMMTNSDLGLTLVDPLNAALTTSFGWDF
jgi:hypothetical protein